MASRELEDFDDLLDRYGGLHKDIITEARRAIKDRRNLLLDIDDLKRENRDLKDDLEDERDAADHFQRRSDERLEEIQSLTDDCNVILCVLDADGCIPLSSLLQKGLAGGQQASTLLTKAIHSHIRRSTTQTQHRGPIQLHTVLYFNKTGLRETCVVNDVCTAREFDEFYLGFGASSPLVSVMDVGEMKEAADAKVREITKMFAFFPQTRAIYFGGGHDNGYATLLRSLSTQGLLHKIVLIRTYNGGFARDIVSLNLASLAVPEVFRSTRLRNLGDVRRTTANARHGPVAGEERRGNEASGRASGSSNGAGSSSLAAEPQVRAEMEVNQHDEDMEYGPEKPGSTLLERMRNVEAQAAPPSEDDNKAAAEVNAGNHTDADIDMFERLEAAQAREPRAPPPPPNSTTKTSKAKEKLRLKIRSPRSADRNRKTVSRRVNKLGSSPRASVLAASPRSPQDQREEREIEAQLGAAERRLDSPSRQLLARRMHQLSPRARVLAASPSARQERAYRPSPLRPRRPRSPDSRSRSRSSSPTRDAPEGDGRRRDQNLNGGTQKLDVQQALDYLAKLKARLEPEGDSYDRFLMIFKMFKSNRTQGNEETLKVFRRVTDLLKGHPDLIEGFKVFCPVGMQFPPPAPSSTTMATPKRTSSTLGGGVSAKRSSARKSERSMQFPINATAAARQPFKSPIRKDLRGGFSGILDAVASGDEMDVSEED